MPTKIKKIFLTLLLLEMFMVYTPAFAQAVQPYDYSQNNTNPVSSEITKYLCSPDIPGGSVLYKCINQLYKFAIVLASVIGVFFIVIAGYVYMSSDGNSEAVDKAKNILESTIASIVILLAGYVLLNAINPDLIQFHSVQPPSVTNIQVGTAGVPAATTPGTGAAVSGTEQQLASQILTLNGSGAVSLATAHASGNVDNANALQNIKDVASGQQAKNSCYTDNGIKAPCKNVDLNTQMLAAIITASNIVKVNVTEIAGGVHSSDMNDPHYTGRAIDIQPVPANSGTQSQLVVSLRNSGAVKIGLECVGGPQNGYEPLTGSNDGDGSCLGKAGYHIHAQW